MTRSSRCSGQDCVTRAGPYCCNGITADKHNQLFSAQYTSRCSTKVYGHNKKHVSPGCPSRACHHMMLALSSYKRLIQPAWRSDTTNLLSRLEHVLSDAQLLLRGGQLLLEVCLLLCQAAQGGSSAGQGRGRLGQGRAVEGVKVGACTQLNG